MKSPEVSFHGYLRREVDNAGKRYEQATKKIFVLTAAPDIEPGPALLKATDILAAAMQVYINALRRLAYYEAHRARKAPLRELLDHA
jgi:hypothetical protein